jgi:hypothetical protein
MFTKNENTYVLLGDRLLGALGQAPQTAFAVKIATFLQGMIRDKTAGLITFPRGTVLPNRGPGAGRHQCLGLCTDEALVWLAGSTCLRGRRQDSVS